MFMPTTEDARVPRSAMVGLCTTLNTPVVDIDGLETGPARAGILLSASEYGDLELWVRVRLISNDQAVTFKYQGDPTELGDPAAAIDAAVSFSEGMGFLFDTDMIDGSGDAVRAEQLWTTLFESEPVSADDSMSGFPPPAADDDVWVLGDDEVDEVVDDEAPLFLELELADEAAPSRGSAAPSADRPAATGASVMTKFRRADPVANTPPTRRNRGETTLGRVELQSEELGEEYVDHAGFLSRLLGSF